MASKRDPTWKSWLQDGTTLLGVTPQRQAELKAQAADLTQKAARGIEKAEGRIHDFEAKAKSNLQDWRKRHTR